MKRALAISFVLHLAVLVGWAWWGESQGSSSAVKLKVALRTEPSPPQEPLPPTPRTPVPRVSDLEPMSSPPSEPVPDHEGFENPVGVPAAASTESAASPVPAVAASLIEEVKPSYPREARKRQWEGVVRLLVTVDEGGAATHGVILESSGHRVLDDAALGALAGARFRPATLGGTPHESQVTIRMRFSLQDN